MKKEIDDRKMIVEYWNKPIDSKTIIKLINVVLNSKWWEIKKKKKEKL